MPSRAFKNLQAARAKKQAEQDAAVGNSNGGTKGLAESSKVNAGGAGNIGAAPVDQKTELTTTNVTPQGPVDVVELSAIDRKVLGQGSKIRVFEGEKLVAELPRRLFCAASTKASELLDGTSDVILPIGTGQLDIAELLDWLRSITMRNHIDRFHSRRDMARDLGICKAARALGMDPYVSHIHRHYWHWIKTRIPNGGEAAIIESLGADDPFINCLGSRFAHLLRRNEVPNEKGFREWIVQFPNVCAKMQASIHEHELRKHRHEANQAQARAQQAAQNVLWGAQ
ncbi:hypothetical protein K491DRAFT_679127 [Lophiostoma macrostomum CBS 122681]|uniref:Uncharacterized protein n=1 Tax=Lophiostoma macrostomum CBS 122681 TaxID=1314788 RepID=A0A6A6T8G5_9PLEO|nr:hypothetical protein K491DRAFT_679127 [Lophiostoma macrostomum CBS 122681]